MPRKSISVESYLVRINTKGLSRRMCQERNAVLVEFVAETNLPTDIGQFRICAYCMIDFDLDPKFYSEECIGKKTIVKVTLFTKSYFTILNYLIICM